MAASDQRSTEMLDDALDAAVSLGEVANPEERYSHEPCPPARVFMG